MSTAHALRQLKNDHAEYDAMMGSSSASGSSDSEALKSTRNELSQILSKIRVSSSDFSATSPETSPEAPQKKAEDEDIKLQRRVLRIITHETEKAANNIVLHVKYLTSPLRLYLKSKVQALPMGQREALVNTIKISDAVKADLVSDWNIKDSFGLKILVKMYRMSQNVFPMFKNHEEFMSYMQPLYDANHMHRKNITFYLYNVVMNPGAVYYTYEQGITMEHEMHQWVDGFLEKFRDELEAVGFDLMDAKQDLIRKITFELNVYASIIFKKSLTFKYTTGQQMKLEAEALIKELHTMYEGTAGTKILAEQMTHWMTTDDDMAAAPRSIRGGAFIQARKTRKR